MAGPVARVLCFGRSCRARVVFWLKVSREFWSPPLLTLLLTFNRNGDRNGVSESCSKILYTSHWTEAGRIQCCSFSPLTQEDAQAAREHCFLGTSSVSSSKITSGSTRPPHLYSFLSGQISRVAFSMITCPMKFKGSDSAGRARFLLSREGYRISYHLCQEML